jgi:hypothetical protein
MMYGTDLRPGPVEANMTETADRLQLPDSLRDQLLAFRRRVWTIKLTESACAAAFGIVVSALLLFALDRVWDTPRWARAILFAAAAMGCAHGVLAVHRWVWRRRRLDQLARLLVQTHPRIGDQLLGVIELVRDESEQARSRRLCEAAIAQVAEDARTRDLGAAVPNPRHRLWIGLAAVPIAMAVGLSAVYPAAAGNAWARLLAPWATTPRYAFAALEPFADRLIVPHGEPFTLTATLSQSALWRPARGVVQLGEQRPVATRLRAGRYQFALPPQIAPGWLSLRIGDARQRIRVQPTLRPELTAVAADVTLPKYLGQARPVRKDVRGGSVALVKGSRARFAVTASRSLADAQVDGRRRPPRGATVDSPQTLIDRAAQVEFRWRDAFGLAGKEPFVLAVDARDDEPPSLACDDLPRQKVVLDSEVLTFKVRAADDFGVKRIGLEWRGGDDPTVKTPAQGERVLAAGGIDKDAMEIAGTFSAKSLGIDPQPLHLRLYAEDYYPGRPRTYSPTFTLYVLTPEQHAIWVTEQLSKWHRQSLEVRDRELALHETNKQLRALDGAELDRPETRKRIETQAAGERANGRRLSNLVTSGEDLVKQATRNPEFGVGHLEKWAEMLQVLKDISANRMPSVADLLKDAASAPMAGTIRDGRSAPSGAKPDAQKNTKAPAVPQVVDRESSQQPLDKSADSPPPSTPGQPSLRLPMTTIAGKSKPPESCPTGRKLDEAVVKQQDLLAEFDKIADELNRVLANLEGSTLVKRLKAASRQQDKIGLRVVDLVGDAFGLTPPRLAAKPAQTLDELGEQEAKGSHDVSLIMDDMQSYFERRRFMNFKTVLDEMRQQDVIGALRQLGDDLKAENGVSIAQCEFWSDTLDRWADDLVDPTSGGT